MTVTISEYENIPAIKMTWERHVDGEDVSTAFKQITSLLNKADTELYCIVDLLQDPLIPIGVTVTEALYGPFRNPRMKAWLFVGQSQTARIIEKTLTSVTGRKNILWFDSEREAIKYVVENTLSSDEQV